jgi:hypothetical protein
MSDSFLRDIIDRDRFDRALNEFLQVNCMYLSPTQSAYFLYLRNGDRDIEIYKNYHRGSYNSILGTALGVLARQGWRDFDVTLKCSTRRRAHHAMVLFEHILSSYPNCSEFRCHFKRISAILEYPAVRVKLPSGRVRIVTVRW